MAITVTQRTTGAQVIDALSDHVRGKHVLLTGVSPQSLGEAAALAIAKGRPALLILASRTPSKLEAVAEQVRKLVQEAGGEDDDGVGKSAVVAVVLDQSSLTATRRAASEIAALTDRLDVIINNAGVCVNTRQTTADGFELTWAVNHLGAFLLTTLLLPQLKNAAARKGATRGSTRVIYVTSAGHKLCPVRFHDFNLEWKPVPHEEEIPADAPGWATANNDGFPGLLAYGQTKTANMLMSVAIRERFLKDPGIDSFCVDAGFIWTGIQVHTHKQFRDMLETVPKDAWKSTDEGIAPVLAAAFDPSITGSDPFLYDEKFQVLEPAPHASDKLIAEKLWAVSEQLTAMSSQVV